jgi:hypothetical protein
VEIVQEFKVENNSFSAEYGNNGGTVVNIVLKEAKTKFTEAMVVRAAVSTRRQRIFS